MNSADNFRNYAVDCVRQAEGQPTPEGKNILLNMALAWVRLAQQAQELPSLQDPTAQDSLLQDAIAEDSLLQNSLMQVSVYDERLDEPPLHELFLDETTPLASKADSDSIVTEEAEDADAAVATAGHSLKAN